MERIEPTGGNRFKRYKKAGSKEKSEKTESVAPFSHILRDHKAEEAERVGGLYPHDIDASIEELLDSLHEKGEKLKEKPTLDNIGEYRRAVSDFLQFIVKHAFEAEKIQGSRFHPLKKQYGYTVIRLINERLDALATGIMQSQYSQLDILRRVEEINGMIVDLLQ